MNLTSSAPTMGFVFGDQSDIRYEAARNGWLSTDSAFNSVYMTKATESLSYKVNTDLFGALRVDIDGDRIYAENYQSYYRVDDVTKVFTEFTPMNRGNFNISYLAINTSFNKSNGEILSHVFQNFLSTRQSVADKLAHDNPEWMKTQEYYYDTVAKQDFPLGYGSNSQTVLYY